MNNSKDIDVLLKSLKSLIEDQEVGSVPPAELSNVDGFEQIYTSLLEIRNAFIAMGTGELAYPIRSKGYFPGAIKGLQASLQHLIWQTKAISSGDFTQRVDFLGELAQAFNSMAERLTLTINDLAIKENESREAKENLELIFNTSPDAVLITSLAGGYIVDINEGFTALSGYTRAEVIGKSSKEVNIWKNPADHQKILTALNEKGFCENIEVVFRRKDGSQLLGMMSARNIVLQGVPHIISVTHDITTRRQAEEEILYLSYHD